MLEPKTSSSGESSQSLTRAESVSLADFSTALSSGVLRAMEARSLSGRKDVRPWIWAGWIIGEGPFGPYNPMDPGGPLGQGGGPTFNE